MSAAVASRSTPDVAPAWRILVAQTRAVLLGYWRLPTFVIFSMALPIMFFLFFGLPYAHEKGPGGITAGAYIMGNLGAYAVSSILVFNVGIGRAQARGQKIDLLQRATPLPGWAVIIADTIGAMVLGLISLLALYLFAALAGGVRLDAGNWLVVMVFSLVGALPLLGLGLAIGYGSGVNAAPAVANLIYLPMSFASGIFIPLSAMPSFLQKVAPYLPTYHYAQFVQHGLAPTTDESLTTAIVWLVGWGIVLFAIAIRMYRMDIARKFS
ncbi:MAG TPA: ABC transporter permease [Candidatus Dormibacteraeota bacterium]|nr:ABC transporter permease [Candidatus Dormibacteraeota bacterium]